MYAFFGLNFLPQRILVLFSHRRADTVQLLHDCIQTCLKVHVEWLEVMKDFSTVFCVPDALTPAATPASTPAQTPSSTLPSLPTHNNNSGYVYNGTPSSLHYQVKSSRSDVMNIISDVMNSNYSQVRRCLTTFVY